VSDHGVDLYRSDTGQYMQWPGALAQVATVPAQQHRTRSVPAVGTIRREDLFDLAPLPAAPSRAWAYATRNTLDRKTLALTLVNWLILLMLLCVFLLAKTLPADTALGTTAGSGVSTIATR
jgi:hypothetical protein